MMDSKGLVLLIEDNPKIQDANKQMLEISGIQTVTAFSIAEARTVLATCRPDVIVLDIMLPDGDGMKFLPEIKRLCDAPVLLLTAKTQRRNKLDALMAGGNDYITKPYDMYELLYKIENYMKLTAARTPVVGNLTFDVISDRALLGGEDLYLTQKEFALLYLLSEHKGRMLTTQSLYEYVWKQPNINSDGAVKVHISNLRRKLSGSGISIISHYGEGYSLEEI